VTIILRSLAIAIAVAAIVDPAVRLTRSTPAAVRMHLDASDPDAQAAAERLRGLLGARVAFDAHGEEPAAEVVVDTAVPKGEGVFDRPLSTIRLDESPSIAIVDAPTSVRLSASSSTLVRLTLAGRGVAGRQSAVRLLDGGIEVARVDHRWRADGSVAIELPFLALQPGTRRLTAEVDGAAGETNLRDNRADIVAMIGLETARVAIIEPRPSWPAGFLRRLLETDSRFQVSSLVRTSTAIETRGGDPPRSFRFDQLVRFDVVVAGAPEELSRAEVDALRRFADVRGGTVVLLPDRRPAGAYADLLPGVAAEQLLSEPRLLEPAQLLASELVPIVPAARAAGVRSLASLGDAVVIGSWAVGDGHVIYSGALDAWRYRSDPRSRLHQFWRDVLLTSALGAPPPLRLAVQPAIVRPGDSARLTARVRRTEYDANGTVAIAATLSDPQGRATMIRLHPGAEAGLLEGEVAIASAGVHGIRVTATSGTASQIAVLADPQAARPARASARLEGVPALTGGVAVAAPNLQPLVDHLSTIAGPSRTVVLNPMRSAWWLAPFTALLCSEWAFRRRRGLQ
jgi:hypothetical protein